MQQNLPPITVGTARDELKTLGEAYGSKDIKFDDPKAAKRQRMSKAFLDGRAKQHEEKRMTRNPPKTAKERTQVDRADIFMEAEVNADPVQTVRARLTKMWIMECKVNDDLYLAEVIDNSALSASNKRLLELSQGLKALPSQTTGENKGTQRSTAELIEDAIKVERKESVEALELGKSMIDKADTAFGEGS